ncbi:MAG: metallophosphoesterase [Bacteroidota bacterium]
MPVCFFVSDIHGNEERYEKLFNLITEEKPHAVFLGGDLLPHPFSSKNFVKDYLTSHFNFIKEKLGANYPRIFIILGNDDARSEESNVKAAAERGVWEYIHFRKVEYKGYKIFGYCFTPPSPFLLKDWEKYDVSRYTEAGCISPEEGKRTVKILEHEKKYSTIKKDLEQLVDNEDVSKAIFLFHGPPYQTNLDRAALDGKILDHIQVDVNVGSVAIRKFIEEKQPLITLHGHIHESAQITGSWKDKIGNTFCFSAAHNGKELAVVKFDACKPENAQRFLL